ncbi:MAG TPA: CaiB/BaiF CoA-transferase family protein [Pseudolabrys sp.]|nr:CaiB/BaiF CoA-transferase family protein [Pseudolabrys sp.]
MPGALSGLRVLDLSRVLAGPWAAQVFGDLGADVIKIERPGTGDETRGWGPPYLKDEAGNDTTEAAYFLSANRNKKSVCVDFTRSEGQRIIRELAAKCDILLENFKLDGLKQYGLDYPSLKEINPRLIYCSITGFGQSGPYAPRAGYDFLIQGMGGLMSITGRKDGEPGAGPQKVGVALTDVLTGLYSVISVLAALNHRHLTGEGQHVDLALLDVQVTSLANQNMNYLTSGLPPVRMGNAHPNIVPYQDFPTADGAMIIAVGNDGQFAALCKVLGHPEWAKDERFATNTLRVKHRETIIGLLSGVTALRPTSDWVKACEGVGVPCGPINDLKAVFDDPHIRARKLKIEMPHPTAGTMPLVGSPIRMSATPVEYRLPPPLLGQHTLSVLEEVLGLSRAEIDALAENKIVQAQGLS